MVTLTKEERKRRKEERKEKLKEKDKEMRTCPRCGGGKVRGTKLCSTCRIQAKAEHKRYSSDLEMYYINDVYRRFH